MYVYYSFKRKNKFKNLKFGFSLGGQTDSGPKEQVKSYFVNI